MTFYKGHRRINSHYGEAGFLQGLAEMKKDWPNRKGEKNGRAKLSELQVRLIRGYACMSMETAERLARICGIHPLYVYHLRNKNMKKWAHLK